MSGAPPAMGTMRLTIKPQTDFYAAGDDRARQEGAELDQAMKRQLPDEFRARPAPDEKGVITEIVIPILSSGALTAAADVFKAWLGGRPKHRSIDVEYEIDQDGKPPRSGTLHIDATNVGDDVLKSVVEGALAAGQ